LGGNVVGVPSSQSVSNPLSKTGLHIKGYLNELEKWFKVFVKFFEIGVRSLWQPEEDFSLVELLHLVKGFLEFLAEVE